MGLISLHDMVAFVYLQKAFDTVDQGILLSKMEHYGVRGVPLSLFKTYLRKREQCTTISNE